MILRETLHRVKRELTAVKTNKTYPLMGFFTRLFYNAPMMGKISQTPWIAII